MPERPKPPLLRAIDGGGARSTRRSVGRLALVDEDGRAPALTVGLPELGAAPAQALIYTTVPALEAAELGHVLRQLGVRRVVDLRFTPSFGALGADGSGFVACLAEHGVHYLHLEALANPYVNDSWHAENYRQRLRRYYGERARPLRLLRRSLDDGPVLVLVAERSAIEFELLVRALRRVEDGFEAHTLPPR